MPFDLRHWVLTPGTNVRRTLHGALNLATGAWHHHVSVNNVSVVFCYFLDMLRTAYPNAPRYSPEDNPVERIRAALKTRIANTAPATITDRIQQAHAFFRNRTPDQNLTTTTTKPPDGP